MGNEYLRARGADLRVARVLHQDERFLTLEVAKQDDWPLQIQDGDEFLTLLFVKQRDGAVHAWLPWESGS